MSSEKGGTRWDRHHTWNLVLPPSRPSSYELCTITEVIARVSRSLPVAVMGSTPEFRDLLAKQGFRHVTVIDAHASFYRSMNDLLTEHRPSGEHFVHDTWQDHFPTVSGKYALILSDLTLGNVPYRDRRVMYAALEESLRRGGYFIDKVLTNEGRSWSTKAIGERFSQLPFNLATINRFNCEALFCGARAANGVLRAGRIYDQLVVEHTDSPRVLALARACEFISPRHMTWYYGRQWEEVRQDYVRVLKLVARIPQPSNSAYHEHAYQFVYEKE